MMAKAASLLQNLSDLVSTYVHPFILLELLLTSL